VNDRIPALTVDEASARMGESVVMLDVREADEWEAGHVDGSLWIPMGELAARQAELPDEQALVVVCRSGNRSARVVQALVGAGYDASNVIGGLEAWVAAEHPLVTDAGAAGVVA
jgi:rhodanese-related sulfurtransferase